jgi:hypothetical protein
VISLWQDAKYRHLQRLPGSPKQEAKKQFRLIYNVYKCKGGNKIMLGWKPKHKELE